MFTLFALRVGLWAMGCGCGWVVEMMEMENALSLREPSGAGVPLHNKFFNMIIIKYIY
jgi:hypothetical protein